MSRFRPIDRKTAYLLPPSVEDWLPEDHLARFIVEAMEKLDLNDLARAYAGRGSAAYHPEVMLGLPVYGYATGVFSSRKIERATPDQVGGRLYDSVAFRTLAAGFHPDHDTLATFRRRFLDELAGVFVQVLELAREMKLLKVGTVCLDGTKIHANASRHSALSHGHLSKLEVQLKAEVQDLLEQAEKADQSDLPDGLNLPEELKRLHDRLAAMEQAKTKIEARARERFEQKQAEYQKKLAKRKARPMKKMAHKLKTQTGRKLYALRKQTVEPVFGIIKSVMGFRQFLLRGLKKVTGEWALACLAWNLKRMAVLRQKSVQWA